MLDQGPLGLLACIAFGAILLVALGFLMRAPLLRGVMAGALTALAASFGLAYGAGMIQKPWAVEPSLHAAAPADDEPVASAIRPPPRLTEAQEMLVAQAVSALAAAPGIADAVRARLAKHESPPAAAGSPASTD